jgi:hypothetical protein
MNLTSTIIKRLLKRKLATAVLVTASLAAFATLGDGGKKNEKPSTAADFLGPRTITLRSPQNYRGNTLYSTSRSGKFILLNTVVTYQKGNATYILPLKKKVFLDKVKFNPSPSHL